MAGLSDTSNDQVRPLVERLAEAIQAERCTLYAVDRGKREVHSLVALGLEIPEIRIGMHRGVVGYVARTGNMLNLKDVYNDPRFDRSVDRQTGYRSKSMLTMAIRDASNRVAGVVQALNKRGGEVFTAQDEETMRQFCADASPLMSPAA